MHAALKGSQTIQDLACLKDEIRRIMSCHGIAHSTVELEFEGEECRMPQGACRKGSREDPSCS
jgi:hypothetical protein